MNAIPHLLVCIIDPVHAWELVCAGRKTADEQALPLKVLAVLPNPKDSKNADVMQTLYNICARFTAELTVLFRKDAAHAVAVTAKQTNTRLLLCDLPPIAGHDFVAQIRECLPELPVTVMDETGAFLPFPPHTVSVAP